MLQGNDNAVRIGGRSGFSFRAGANLTPPENVSAPEVSNASVTEGATISTTDGTWTGNPAPTFTYQWREGINDLSGETGSTFDTTGHPSITAYCRVTATNSEGSAFADSDGCQIAPA